MSIFNTLIFLMCFSVRAQGGPAALKPLTSEETPSFKKAQWNKKALDLAAKRVLDYAAQLPPGSAIDAGGHSWKPKILADSAQELLKINHESRTRAEFFKALKNNFELFQSLGIDGKGRVIFSDYYEPVLSARFHKDSVYRYPIYRLPADKALSSLSRKAIDLDHALAGRGLALAWLKSPFDVFDLQVQGSGILEFPDGSEILAQYAATNGLPYRPIGSLLIRQGIFKKGKISKDALRAYLEDHPKKEGEILAQDPRYVFFKLDPFEPGEEPQGTAHEPLVPGASIAIDPAYIPLGALAYIETTSPRADRKGRFLGRFKRRSFAFCLDTGGAIKGPGRVDMYVGHGAQARTESSNQWNPGKLFILIKKSR
jgi:membrane-bound lytic murein transglycosylase A